MAYYENMTENLKTAMEIANQITTNLSATYIGSEHLLFGCLKTENCSAYKLLTECGVNPSEYERVFLNSIDPNYAPQGMTTRTVQMFKNAMRFSDQTKTLTGTSHFLLAVLDSESCMAVKILKSLGVDITKLGKDDLMELGSFFAKYGDYSILKKLGVDTGNRELEEYYDRLIKKYKAV